MSTHRVFIVEDNEVMRRGLVFLIEAEPDLEMCGEAGTSAEALERISLSAPDIILVDVSLKGDSGISLVEAIRERWPELRTLMLSGHIESRYVQQSLDAGARGFLAKDKAAEHLTEAIREVACGGRYLSDRVRKWAGE